MTKAVLKKKYHILEKADVQERDKTFLEYVTTLYDITFKSFEIRQNY